MFYSIMMLVSTITLLITDDTSYMIAAAIWGLGAVFANGFKFRR